MNEEDRAYRIYKLSTGTSIDHIPAGRGIAVAKVLGLQKPGQAILAIGVNLESKKMGRKDVIKIEDKQLTQEEMNKVCLIAPNATINILQDHRVVRKLKPDVPDMVENLAECRNPNCITNIQPVTTKFDFDRKEDTLKCFFCERYYPLDGIRVRR